METQGGTPFISPLQPSTREDHRGFLAKLSILSLVLTTLFLICMGVFIYQAL